MNFTWHKFVLIYRYKQYVHLHSISYFGSLSNLLQEIYQFEIFSVFGRGALTRSGLFTIPRIVKQTLNQPYPMEVSATDWPFCRIHEDARLTYKFIEFIVDILYKYIYIIQFWYYYIFYMLNIWKWIVS